MNVKYLLYLILGLQANLLVAQNSNYSQQLDSILGIDKLYEKKIDSTEVYYKQALDQANQYYKEQKYAESVVYYRKALKIKPEERLPKYRIEDVYTLFLTNDVVATKEEAKQLVAEVEMSFDNFKNEKAFIQKTEEPRKVESIQTIETKKTELPTTKVAEKEIVAPTMGVSTKTAIKEETPVKIEPKPIEKPIVVEQAKPKEPENKIVEPKPVAVVETKPKETPKTFVEPKPIPTQTKVAPTEEFESNDKLLQKYSAKKTVEVITEPTKTITNVYINSGAEVIVYSKVKHSWGGEFYFAKYPSLPKKNISLQHFMNSTGGIE